jgi:hypothetical protein
MGSLTAAPDDTASVTERPLITELKAEGRRGRKRAIGRRGKLDLR